ncbi:MAG: hypothetical protein ACLFQA_07075 [Bacteroidales bacterium]
MDENKADQLCPRCKNHIAKEEICPGCISELLDLHDHRIGWKVALEIEKEEKDGENIFIEIQ